MIELDYSRRSQRRYSEMPIELIQSDWEQPLGHRVQDISAHGAWVRTSLALPLGQELVVEFKTPVSDRAWTLLARVRRVKKGVGLGIEFTNLSRGERWELTRELRGLTALEQCRSHLSCPSN